MPFKQYITQNHSIEDVFGSNSTIELPTYRNVFTALNGFLEIKNNIFKRCVSEFGLIYTANNNKLLIKNSTFDGLIGKKYGSIIFSIQNKGGFAKIMRAGELVISCVELRGDLCDTRQ